VTVKPFVALLLIVLLFLEFNAVALLASEASDGNSSVASNSVSLGDYSYSMFARSDGHIVLVKTMAINSKDKRQEYALELNEVVTESSRKAGAHLGNLQSKGSRIVGVTLCKWSKTSLLAVIKVMEQDHATFWCLGIQHTERIARDTKVIPAAACFLTSGHSKDAVLSMSGDIEPPGLVIVLGARQANNPNSITHIKVFAEWCGEFAGIELTEFGSPEMSK